MYMDEDIPEEMLLRYIFHRTIECLPPFMFKISIKTDDTTFKKTLKRPFTLTVTQKNGTWFGEFKRKDGVFSFEEKTGLFNSSCPFQRYMNVLK